MEASPSRSHPITFDVFLSFRGEETRNTFIGFLYKALDQLGMMTFMDDKKLLIGDDLNEELVKAIEESRFAIVVLSKDYASSKWCLRELAKIMDCMTEKRQILPIFYHVDPSHLRNLSKEFEKKFKEHEVKYPKEVQQWKDALKSLGSLTGEVVTKDTSEVHIVDNIKNQIFDMLPTRLVAPDRYDSLVDMPMRLQQLDVLLGLNSNEVRFVAIVGMGGIGKTTIAKVLYDKIAPEFMESSCFLHISKCNLVSVQRQLLSRLFKKENIEIMNEDHGAEIIGNRLSSRKVLIVLDGISEKTQLEKLAGSPNWFGPRSRVIVTTRNRDILPWPPSETMRQYNVDLLCYESALTLFQKHAFGDDDPSENLMHLVNEIVPKIDGNPLGLIEIGKGLNGQSIDIWNEELERLINVSNERLYDTLKIGFDELGTRSQQVFLDLACFFNGAMKKRVLEILESFGYSAHSELQLLCDRSLIEVRDDKIFIHNFIQAMGQKIGRAKQSRFWLRDDVLDAFDKRRGVKDVEGIVLDMKESQDKIELEAVLFRDMTLLRILEIGNVKLDGNISHLSKQLRLLNWHGYPLQCLPSSFESRHLFELLLPIGQTVQLWRGQKKFEKLKVIDAKDSKYLKETPDFTKAPKLERLILRNCTRLSKIDRSIRLLNHLVLLDLRRCVSLKNFSTANINNENCKILTGSSSRKS